MPSENCISKGFQSFVKAAKNNEGRTMKVDLLNRVALITGATSGIGQGMALMFAQNGANIVVNGRNEERGLVVVEEIKAIGKRAIFIKADVGDAKEVGVMVDKVVEEFGKIDILINNAGINVDLKERQPIHLFNDEKWKKIMNIDLDGVYYCSKAVLKNMKMQRWGMHETMDKTEKQQGGDLFQQL